MNLKLIVFSVLLIYLPTCLAVRGGVGHRGGGNLQGQVQQRWSQDRVITTYPNYYYNNPGYYYTDPSTLYSPPYDYVNSVYYFYDNYGNKIYYTYQGGSLVYLK